MGDAEFRVAKLHTNLGPQGPRFAVSSNFAPSHNYAIAFRGIDGST